MWVEKAAEFIVFQFFAYFSMLEWRRVEFTGGAAGNLSGTYGTQKKKRSQTDGHIATHLSVVIEWGKLCYCTWTSSRNCIVFGPVALAMDFAILLYFYQRLNCMPTID